MTKAAETDFLVVTAQPGSDTLNDNMLARLAEAIPTLPKADRLGDAGGTLIAEHDAGPCDRLGYGRGSEADHGEACGHRLDDRHTEALVLGETQKHARSAIPGGELCIVDRARELDDVGEPEAFNQRGERATVGVDRR